MTISIRFSALVAVTAFAAACADTTENESQIEFSRPEAVSELATEITTNVVMKIPMTTTLPEATSRFLQGVRAQDMARISAAHEHYVMAIELDPTMAMGHLRTAETAPSFELFGTHLALAERNAPMATPAVQLLIRYRRNAFDRNRDAQLTIAMELVETVPDSPSAWLTLADIQTTLADHEAARISLKSAVRLAPKSARSHMALGASYMNGEPRDFDIAREHMQHAVNLEPDEQITHDNLGDILRAMNDLELARDEYTRAHRLAPDNASPLQQRGHTNSFLGEFDAARADYDQAIARGRANQASAYAIWRAYVNLYEGNPQAAITELEELFGTIDGLNIPEPLGQKIIVLTNIAAIAIHIEDLDKADDALIRRTDLMTEQSMQVNQPDFTRGQEADVASFDGRLAATRGDTETAQEKLQEYIALVELDANPRKMEIAHEIMGLMSVNQGDPSAAVLHFEQGNLGNVYVRYLLANAHEAAGNTSEASQIFDEIAIHNFNSLGFALIRSEVVAKR